jgi:hypothetical protein
MVSREAAERHGPAVSTTEPETLVDTVESEPELISPKPETWLKARYIQATTHWI